MKLRLCTLCSGYDSQLMALRRIKGLDVDLVYWSDIDENAILAHNALYPEYTDRNLGDMTKIDWTKCQDFDLLTYSTPCQSVSIGGHRDGIEKGSGTRSSIIWSVEDCIKTKLPKYLLMENVKGLMTKQFRPFFDEWCQLLESYGYKNYWKIINAKDYGVRQNRERLIMISILNAEKDYVFPENIDFINDLDDVLEHEVDESYYIKEDIMSPFITSELSKIGIQDDSKYMQSDVLEGKITKKILFWSRDKKGKVVRRIPRDWSPCITSFSCSTMYTTTIIVLEYEGDKDIKNVSELKDIKYRMRRLTPKELFYLMDVNKTDTDKILNSGCKKTTLLAGNSIVVNVLTRCFESLFQ